MAVFQESGSFSKRVQGDESGREAQDFGTAYQVCNVSCSFCYLLGYRNCSHPTLPTSDEFVYFNSVPSLVVSSSSVADQFPPLASRHTGKRSRKERSSYYQVDPICLHTSIVPVVPKTNLASIKLSPPQSPSNKDKKAQNAVKKNKKENVVRTNVAKTTKQLDNKVANNSIGSNSSKSKQKLMKSNNLSYRVEVVVDKSLPAPNSTSSRSANVTNSSRSPTKQTSSPVVTNQHYRKCSNFVFDRYVPAPINSFFATPSLGNKYREHYKYCISSRRPKSTPKISKTAGQFLKQSPSKPEQRTLSKNTKKVSFVKQNKWSYLDQFDEMDQYKENQEDCSSIEKDKKRSSGKVRAKGTQAKQSKNLPAPALLPKPTRTNKENVQKKFKNCPTNFYYTPSFNNNYGHVKMCSNTNKNVSIENKTELNKNVHNSSVEQDLKIKNCPDENNNFSNDKLFSDKVDDSVDLIDFSDDSLVTNNDVSFDLMDFSDESIVNNNNNLSENTVLTNQDNHVESSLVSQPLTKTNQGTNSKIDNDFILIKWEDYIVIEAQKLCSDMEFILNDTRLEKVLTTVFNFSNRVDSFVAILINDFSYAAQKSEEATEALRNMHTKDEIINFMLAKYMDSLEVMLGEIKKTMLGTNLSKIWEVHSKIDDLIYNYETSILPSRLGLTDSLVEYSVTETGEVIKQMVPETANLTSPNKLPTNLKKSDSSLSLSEDEFY